MAAEFGPMKEILNLKEAAAYLNVGCGTLRIFEMRGLIPSVRYPSIVREGKRPKRLFRKQDLDNFVISSLTGVGENDGLDSGHISKITSGEIQQIGATLDRGQKSRKRGDPLWMEKHVDKR